jgi:hypothetical protein
MILLATNVYQFFINCIHFALLVFELSPRVTNSQNSGPGTRTFSPLDRHFDSKSIRLVEVGEGCDSFLVI